MKRLVALLVIFSYFFAACSNGISPAATPSPQLTPSPEVSPQETPYPALGESGGAATTDYSSQFIEVTQDPEMGSLEADIYYKGKPLAFYTFFLADVLVDPNSGMDLSTALDKTTAPRALSDQSGHIAFKNVPPGRYGLILIEGIDTYLLLNPKDGSAILVNIEAGKNIDLGRFDYDDLPVD